MIYLFCVMIPYLLGRGTLRALYGKTKSMDLTWMDTILTGGMVVIGLAEAAHMGAVILGRSFSDCVVLFLVGLVVLLALAILLIIVENHIKKKDNKALAREAEQMRVRKVLDGKGNQLPKQIMFFAFAVIVLIQVLLLLNDGKRYLNGDMTVETVNTTLFTNSINQVNPMTGQPYTLGMPFRLKILCLPTLYAILCNLFGMNSVQVVWTVVPVMILLGSYVAYASLAKSLFAEDSEKRNIFMLFVALLLWVGDYMYGMDGFAVQYSGFRGVSIRMAILVPYTVSLILRRQWKLVILCVLAEACIVWTLYGMGVCLFVALGMLLTGLLVDKFGKGGEGAFR